jgi:hypothetical protein
VSQSPQHPDPHRAGKAGAVSGDEAERTMTMAIFFVIASSLFVGFSSAWMLCGQSDSIFAIGMIALNVVSIIVNARNLVEK